MTPKFHILKLFCITNTLIISQICGLNIQVYKHQNFTGLLWESNSTAECNNIPKSENDNVFSIRTDTCVIVYHDPDCKSRWSMKYMPGDVDLTEFDLGRDGRIRSFHTCNDEEGGDQLNVDITKYYTFSYLSSFVPDVLQSYKNVCACVNVPQCVQNMDIWSINNHHNSLLAYFEPNCSEIKWNSKLIPAGHSMDSRYMHDHIQTDSVTKTTHKIQSFGPNPVSLYYKTSCMSSNFIVEKMRTVTAENVEDNESTTKRYEESDVMTHISILTDKIVKLETLLEKSKQKFENFQNWMETIFERQQSDFNKFSEKIEDYIVKFDSCLKKLNLTC